MEDLLQERMQPIDPFHETASGKIVHLLVILHCSGLQSAHYQGPDVKDLRTTLETVLE